MCYIGVIEVFLVLRVWFIGAVNTTLNIINLILYINCWSLNEISLFFWRGYSGITVEKEKRWNHFYWQPCTIGRDINPCKGEVPLIYSLRGTYHRRWIIELGFCDVWEIGQLFSDGSSINNNKFCDHRRWMIGIEFCDRWEDGRK